MIISIFGLGYVGAVSAGCLSKDGHTIIGVDPNKTKVELINKGQTPIIEEDIGKLITDGHQQKRLRATTSTQEAIMESDLSLVCVGTPSQNNGNLDLTYICRVSELIGEELKNKSIFHVIVLRSTVLPGTTQNVVIPILEERSGKTAGKDFGVCYNPEFLREGTAVYDFYNPPKTVIGEIDNISGDIVASIYEKIDAPLIRTRIEVSEMVKYTDNNWHAVKVAFANEIGAISKKLGIDSHQVMNIFCKDEKLNISTYYLNPGFAFGGSCLPKDVRALNYKARSLDLDLPLLGNVMRSNQSHIARALQQIIEKGNRKIGVLGFSFKTGTDDLRESPMVEIIERLIGKGYDIRLYDRNVNIASLIGANRDYIMNRIPHISKLMMTTMKGVIEHAETIVIGNNSREFRHLVKDIGKDQVIVDLVRGIVPPDEMLQYDGLCW